MFGIFDCNGIQVGNPKGYKTVRIARSIATRRTGKAYKQIWQAFEAKQATLDATGYPKSGRLIYKIDLILSATTFTENGLS